MQRDIRSEFLAAAVLVLLLAAVGLSALILSDAGEETDTSPTPPDIVSNVDDETTPSESSETVTASEEVTVTPTHTRTERPTVTDTPSNTDTPNATATETETEMPTNTTRPTRTLRPLSTSTRGTTATATETETETPTRTATATTTETETETPTRTRRPTRTPRPSRTPTPRPTTEAPAPSRTPTATNTSVPLAQASLPPCTAPDDWTTYTVQRGNTLFSIARSVGSTVGELRTINCLPDADNIGTGDVLAVPRAPNRPIQTGIPILPDETTIATYVKEGCTVAASSIRSPVPGQRLSGLFEVEGTAALDDFQYYRLEVRPDFTNIYNFYSRSDSPMVNGVLGRINAELFEDGLYWVRLTVVDNTGNFIEPCAVPVIFD